MSVVAHARLEVGQEAIVYLDPITRQRIEGTAVLVQRIRTLPGEYSDGRLRLWKVRFAASSEIRQRAIWEPSDG